MLEQQAKLVTNKMLQKILKGKEVVNILEKPWKVEFDKMPNRHFWIWLFFDSSFMLFFLVT